MAFTKANLTATVNTIKEAWTKFNNLIDDLLSVASGKGASQIGIHDSAGNMDAANVEDALAEIYTDYSSARTEVGAFDEDSDLVSGLTWGHASGRIRSDNVVTTVSAGTIALTDDASNYVELKADGTLTRNTAGFTAGRIPLREVVCAGGVQTTSTDKRAWFVADMASVSIGSYGGDFDAAITAIDSTETTLYIDSAATMSANVTVPTTCKVIVQKGGVIARSTYTLTMNGPFECGPYEAFTGSGTTTFGAGSVKEILPEWEGIDGTSDDIEIELAIASGSTNRVPVRLTQDYTVSGSITMPDNAMIYSKNRSTITVANDSDISVFVIGGNNITIKGIVAEGNKANQTTGRFVYASDGALTIDNTHIEDCEINDFKTYGIHMGEKCTNQTYINNKIDGCGNGMLVAPLLTDTADNIRIEGNHVLNSGGNGIQVYHADAVRSTNIFIIGNYVYEAASVSIEIQRATTGVISNNIVRGGLHGISVGSCQYVTVTGNVITDQDYYGIEMAAIAEGGNAVITGNELYDCGTGIIAQQDDATYSYMLNISNNLIDTTTDQEGIEIKNVSQAVISSNVIKDPETVGIRVGGLGAAMDVSDVSVINNVIKFEAALSAQLSGIVMGGVDGGKISGNLIITDVSGSAATDSVIGISFHTKNVYVTDNIIYGTVAIAARGIKSSATTNEYTYILRNSIKNMTIGIETVSNTNPEVTILDNLIEGSSTSDISEHASHKTDRKDSTPTSGSLWRVGDQVWETAPTAEAAPGWVCVSRVKTEMRIAGLITATTLEVDSTTGMTAGDIIGVELDGGAWHWTTVASVTDGDTVVITAGLAAAAAIDNDVVTNLWKTMAVLGA